MTSAIDLIVYRLRKGEVLNGVRLGRELGISTSTLSASIGYFAKHEGVKLARETIEADGRKWAGYRLVKPGTTERWTGPLVEPGPLDPRQPRPNGRSAASKHTRSRLPTPVEASVIHADARHAARPATSNGHSAVMTVAKPTRRGAATVWPMPVLGQTVTVSGLLLDDDGTVTVVLRDVTGSAWTATVRSASTS